ncbi:polyubiquitin precursor, partial [Ramicandelaber brevisporus]
DTVKVLKLMIQSKTSIHINQQRLYFDNQMLVNSQALSKYYLWNGATLELLLCPVGFVMVIIRMLTGKCLPLIVNLFETIESVKDKISKLENIHICNLRLIFDGKLLQNEQLVSDCSIQDGSEIHLVLRLGGIYCPDCLAGPDE